MKPSELLPDSVAVITGGASGIGLAAARRFAAMGFSVCVTDLQKDKLKAAAAEIAAQSPKGADAVMAEQVDVSDIEAMECLEADVRKRFGGTDILMNNAGIQPGSDIFGPDRNWEKVLGVNLMGVISGAQIFVPNMIKRGRPGIVVNTGSKQGITTPPGDPAYNIAKAGVKVFTEQLQHTLRNTEGCKICAHLLIPGFVFTGLTAHGRTEKPEGAWTPEQTIGFMIDRLEAGDFYILCPDNEANRSVDERRIAWAAADIIENRPALSRWHPDWKDRFEGFVAAAE
jgi:NAD(P)-dependent dehydrogenase (short-subunit alcohol dehydrogenase family)